MERERGIKFDSDDQRLIVVDLFEWGLEAVSVCTGNYAILQTQSVSIEARLHAKLLLLIKY